MVTPVALVAVTVNVDEAPAAIDVGFAVMVTVGAGLAVIVTVAVAEALPPGPVAVAVYVVVAPGLTDCVPPLADRLYELPSEPVTVTPVAFVAATVRVEEPPACTDVGAAEMLTEGSGEAVNCPLFEPHPAARMAKREMQTVPKNRRASDLKTRAAGTVTFSSIGTRSKPGRVREAVYYHGPQTIRPVVSHF